MSNLIKEKFNEKIAIILQEQWTKQCQTEEFKSMQELKKKNNSIKKPGCQSVNQNMGVVTETLINKKNIYRTKYIIGMNITKTNTKEETFTNVLLGKEENNKDATETQGKTTQRVINFKETSNNHQNQKRLEIHYLKF